MRPDFDGICRTEWRDEDSAIPRPPDPVRTSRSIETVGAAAASAAPSLDASEPYEARFAAWERRLEEALDDDIENGGDGEITAVELAPWIAANLLEAIDQAVAGVLEKMRTETGALRRSLEVERERRTAERRRHVAAASTQRKRLEALEAQAVEDKAAILGGFNLLDHEIDMILQPFSAEIHY